MVAFRSPGAVNTGGFINAAAAVGADATSLADTTFKASPSYDTISALVARGQGVTDRQTIKYAGSLLGNQQQERMDPSLLDAFKRNPYTQSLSSF